MDRDRETPRDRDEVFERIPWETLQQPPRDNSRLVIYVAGAVVVGALAFSFVRSQPATVVMPPPTTPEAAVPTVPATLLQPPILRSEADLYAVDHDRMLAYAAAHAEWFAVEYMTVDGSDTSRETLEMLLPQGVPTPTALEGTQVFVDWVGAAAVTEIAPFTYEVEIVVRSMSAAPSEGFVRQPPLRIVVEVVIGADGHPRVIRPPRVMPVPSLTPYPMAMSSVPDTIRLGVEESHGTVVGGEQLPDGRWMVVAMVTSADGVIRPRTVVVP